MNFFTRPLSLFTIPTASRPKHVPENAAALDFALLSAELRAIDAVFSRTSRKQ